MKLVARNKKAFFDYKILDDVEAGISLKGQEIKAIRANRVNINGSYVRPMVGQSGQVELWWLGGNFNLDGDNLRTKKLLLHRSEIEKLAGKISAGGHTLLPLELYLKRGKAKLKIGLGVHKKKYDKRELLRRRDIERELNRRLKK